MSQFRTASAILHIGAKKTGKTYGTQLIVNDMLVRQRKSCLIYDPNNQSEYDQYAKINITQVRLFFQRDNQARKKKDYEPKLVVCRDATVQEMFDTIFLYVRNGVILFEDSTSYMSGVLEEFIQRVIFQSRNHGNDLIFNLHSLQDPAPFLFRHTEYILLRQTADDPEKLPSKVPVKDKVRQAMLEIRLENQRKYPVPTDPKLAFRLIDIQSL